MSGIYVIVGPSGVGKDTLMEAVSARLPQVELVRRVITRPEAAGGEVFEGVSEAEFERRRARGDFVLHWQAHGMSYGIARSILARVAEGRAVVFNGSRAMLGEAAQALPGLTIIHVTARPDVLAARLAGRNRETAEEIAQRLARAALPLPEGLDVVEIDNSGPLEEAVEALVRRIQPVRA